MTAGRLSHVMPSHGTTGDIDEEAEMERTLGFTDFDIDDQEMDKHEFRITGIML